MIPYDSFLLFPHFLLSFLLDLSFPVLIRDPLSPILPIRSLISQYSLCCLLTPLPWQQPPLSFPGFCGYSKLCTHIWRFGARSLRWGRPCNVCLSGSGFLHSIWSFLDPRLVGYLRQGLTMETQLALNSKSSSFASWNAGITSKYFNTKFSLFL